MGPQVALYKLASRMRPAGRAWETHDFCYGDIAKTEL
jgi:hypothetical protein